MRTKVGFASSQFLAPAASVKNPSFSKDAEIAEKVIELATSGLSLSKNFALGRGNGLSTSNCKLFGLLHPATAAAQNSLDASDSDGYFVGAKGEIFPPVTALKDVTAVIPQSGLRNNETLIYVNGISTTRKRQADNLQYIANSTGSRVIGIYNATQNGLLDVVQSFGDTLDDVGENPAIETLADTIYNELRQGRDAHLFAYSQGAIIVSRALQDVSNCLRLEDGFSRQEAESLLSQVKVETFGGAARRFPDGPEYVHYINRKDLVPQLFGLREFLSPLAHKGCGAVTHYFSAGSGFLTHGLEDIYLRERVPFELARAGDFKY